jgi:hypothetical protein
MSFEDLISAPVPISGQKVAPVTQGETRCGYCIGHRKQCFECAYQDKKSKFTIYLHDYPKKHRGSIERQ